MNKIFTTLLLCLSCFVLKAQIIITGVMYDPAGDDALAAGTTANGYEYKGGYEYMQFMATQDIDFSITPYSVVVCKNTTGFGAVDPTKAWAAGGDRTYKFNLTSGTVTKGKFFYVGGAEKTIAGYVVVSGVYTPTLDLKDLNWIRSFPYSNDSDGIVFDDFGNSTTGLFPNGASNPFGIAVFAGTNVIGSSAPIDAIFVATANPLTSNGVTYSSGGYKMPDNDRYESSAFFASSTKNKFAFLYQDVASIGLPINQGNFLKLGGKYDLNTKKWLEPRSTNYVVLVPTKNAAGAAFATLEMIEGNGATVLPIELTSFSAKRDGNAIRLNWETASEKDNERFAILRSGSDNNFIEIASVKGAGTKNEHTNYSFVDYQPLAGINYYKLKQIDRNGESSETQVVTASLSLDDLKFNVLIKDGITLDVNAPKAGKAKILLSDIQGRKIKELQLDLTKGMNAIPLHISLPKGIYFAVLQLEGEKVYEKFAIQ